MNFQAYSWVVIIGYWGGLENPKLFGGDIGGKIIGYWGGLENPKLFLWGKLVKKNGVKGGISRAKGYMDP